MTLTYPQALEIATKYHKGQVRKFSGLPYITHPIAVADQFASGALKIAAVLHDTIEDTDLTLDELYYLGASKDTIERVKLLTHKPGQLYVNYILKIKAHTTARLIKIADIEHNLSDLQDGHLKEKYLMALHILKT